MMPSPFRLAFLFATVVGCDGSRASLGATAHPKLITEDWRATLGQAGAGVGSAVAGAGDVNGDGYDDVIVGARYYDGGQTDEGAAMVFLGSATGLSTTPDWWIESDQAGAELGFSVAGLGDVNGDGYDDIAVGSPKYDGARSDGGRITVYYGSPAGPSVSWSEEVSSSWGWLGWSVAGAGDVNGDGYDDLIAGAPDVNITGRVFLYLGRSTGLPSTADLELSGAGINTGFGYYVSGVGDVDGDGYDDVAVGEPWYAGGASGGGRAQLYRGTASGVDTSAIWSRVGTQADARLGNVVRSAGDLNADGYADLFVSIGDYDTAKVDVGGIEVYHGAAHSPGMIPAFSVLGTQASEWLEYGGAAGDTNGDGYDDLLIGAARHTNGESGEGSAWIYPGSATGASLSPSIQMEPDVASAFFGAAIGGAGDVNGDGLADVIVGALTWTGTASAEGAAFVYLGSDGGGDTGQDTNSDNHDTAPPGDTAPPEDTAPPGDTGSPEDSGSPEVSKGEVSDPISLTMGCGCASGPRPVSWAALAALLLMWRRSRLDVAGPQGQ